MEIRLSIISSSKSEVGSSFSDKATIKEVCIDEQISPEEMEAPARLGNLEDDEHLHLVIPKSGSEVSLQKQALVLLKQLSAIILLLNGTDLQRIQLHDSESSSGNIEQQKQERVKKIPVAQTADKDVCFHWSKWKKCKKGSRCRFNQGHTWQKGDAMIDDFGIIICPEHNLIPGSCMSRQLCPRSHLSVYTGPVANTTIIPIT
jgi:hypothetical protein